MLRDYKAKRNELLLEGNFVDQGISLTKKLKIIQLQKYRLVACRQFILHFVKILNLHHLIQAEELA